MIIWEKSHYQYLLKTHKILKNDFNCIICDQLLEENYYYY